MILPKRPRSADGKPGILGSALREMKAAQKEIEKDRLDEETRLGILGKALEEIKDQRYVRRSVCYFFL